MPLAASLRVDTCKDRRRSFRKTSEEGAIEPRSASKMERTTEPIKSISLNFKMVKLRYTKGSLAQVHTGRKRQSRDWALLILG